MPRVECRVVASHKFGDVVDPLDRIAEAAALLDPKPKSKRDAANYELRHALQRLAMVVVDYRALGHSR